MGRKQARADAERDSKARKATRFPRRSAALLAAAKILSPHPAEARTPDTIYAQPPPTAAFLAPGSTEAGTSGFSALRPGAIRYSEAFRDSNFTCETGSGMVRISGDVEGGKIEFAVPLDMGAVRGIYRAGSHVRLLSDNYLIVPRADGTDPVNIALPQEAKGALSSWLSSETAFYILSLDGQVHATKPEEAGCPWYSGGPFRVGAGATLMESRGLLAIVQGTDTPVILLKVVLGGEWSAISVHVRVQPQGSPSITITPTGFSVSFGNCEVVVDIPFEGDINSVTPAVTQ